MEAIEASQGQPKKITKRGRPKGTFTTPPMFWNDVWLWVEAYRWLKWTRTGNLLSVSNACRLVAKQGGLSWAIGGNINAIGVQYLDDHQNEQQSVDDVPAHAGEPWCRRCPCR
jgi:hypothetical protein